MSKKYTSVALGPLSEGTHVLKVRSGTVNGKPWFIVVEVGKGKSTIRLTGTYEELATIKSIYAGDVHRVARMLEGVKSRLADLKENTITFNLDFLLSPPKK
jgi:hypothetical protein